MGQRHCRLSSYFDCAEVHLIFNKRSEVKDKKIEVHLVLKTRRGSEIMKTPDASSLLASAHIANDETTASLHLDNRNPTPQVRQPKRQ